MDNREMINKALEYIGEAWKDEELSLEKVAEHAGFSVSYFDRLFAGQTGKSVMEYVRVYKLTQSAGLLRTSDKSILEIALELGYANPENYARAFRAQYGVSPSEYREKRKSTALTWKDLSTGTAAKRLENACPGLLRVDPDELTDYLLTTDPIRYADEVTTMLWVDGTVYRLSDDNEYIRVEEYRQEEMTLSFFCREENLEKYLGITRLFPKYMVNFYCDTDFELPDGKYGFEGDTIHELLNYAYLSDHIEPFSNERYRIRELTAEDSKAMSAFQATDGSKLMGLFEHKYLRGAINPSKIIGLYDNRNLIGCAVPVFQEARGIKISDLGGFFFLAALDTKENRRLLWAYIIELALREGYLPVNSGAQDHSGESAEMGYTLVSKRYAFVHGDIGSE